MFQLNFNQHFVLRFLFIIVLLVISGLSSLWSLNSINESTSRVNQTAVPVVQLTNRVQIHLLKLAKLSSLAYNAEEQNVLHVFKGKFEKGVKEFDVLFSKLQRLADIDPTLHTLVIGVKSNYDFYRFAVTEMFEAKLANIKARDEVNAEAVELSELTDVLGEALVNLQYFRAEGEHLKSMKLVAGFAEQADSHVLSIVKTIDEIQRAGSTDEIPSAEDFRFTVKGSKLWYDKGAERFVEFGDSKYTFAVDSAYRDLDSRFETRPTIVDLKTEELRQLSIAWEKFKEADFSVSQSIFELDELLSTADQQFKDLQGQVSDSLDLGYQTSIIMLMVLALFAARNFASMRVALRRRLYNLTSLGKATARVSAAQSESHALEEVMQALHKKIGITEGSLFLLDDQQRLVLHSSFPPRVIEPDTLPASFKVGEGVIGKAAKSKLIQFVPNTEKEQSYISREFEGYQKALLCVPLIDKDIVIGVINLSADVRRVKFSDSDYSYVSSIAQSMVIVLKHLRQRRILEETTRKLELDLHERGSGLRKKELEVSSLMTNLKQGLFTVIAGGVLGKEHSAMLEEVLETDYIVGRNIYDLLLTQGTLSRSSADETMAAIDEIVGADEMLFELNAHRLVREITLQFDNSSDKHLELDWDPVVNEFKTIEQLMVTVRDVTEVKALENLVKTQKRELALIAEVLAIDAAKFGEFLSSSRQSLLACQQAVRNNDEFCAEVVEELNRNIQVVKNNARTFGLRYLVSSIQESESTLGELGSDNTDWNKEALLNGVTCVQRQLADYESIYRDKLGRDGEVHRSVSIDSECIAGWLESIREITSRTTDVEVKAVMSNAYNKLLALEAKPLSEVINGPLSAVAEIASRAGKAVPRVEVHDGDVLLDGRIQSMISNTFSHVLRNTIEHCLEGPLERVKSGKSSQGNIDIDMRTGGGVLVISVRDDGFGLSLQGLRSLAVEKGLVERGQAICDQELVDLVFDSSLAIEDQARYLSGQGVGMEGVRQLLASENGSLQLHLLEKRDGASNTAFELLISLPDYFNCNLINAEGAVVR